MFILQLEYGLESSNADSGQQRRRNTFFLWLHLDLCLDESSFCAAVSPVPRTILNVPYANVYDVLCPFLHEVQGKPRKIEFPQADRTTDSDLDLLLPLYRILDQGVNEAKKLLFVLP